MRNYCELVLYVGRCPADGLTPGRFDPGNTDLYSLKRRADALRTIEKYLLPSQNWALIIDYNKLVRDNSEAVRLVEHAKRSFTAAKEIVEPHQCIHGRIIFARKMRFDNCGEDDADGIVKAMKESGHRPHEVVQKADWIRKTYRSEKTVRSKLGELEEKVDDAWKSALKFY